MAANPGVFVGYQAGLNNTAAYNTFVGINAGRTNTTGERNTFVGYAAGQNNTGTNNTFLGLLSGVTNTSGSYNTFLGKDAGYANTTGEFNVAIGSTSGNSFATCSTSVFVGYLADAGSNNLTNATALGNGAIVTQSNSMYLGNSSLNNGVYTVSGLYQTSDARFKFNVQENVKGLEFIKRLRPVTYQLSTKSLDDFIIQNMPDSVKTKHQEGMDFATGTAMVQAGFIAQEVEQAGIDAGFTSQIVSS